MAIPLTLSVSEQARSDYPDATKTASGTINTTGLSPGRHMVYVQGTNADGKAGALSAAFLTVTAAPPAPAPEPTSTGGGAIGLGWPLLLGLATLGLAGLGRRRS